MNTEDSLEVHLLIPGYSSVPTTVFRTRSFGHPHDRKYVINENGELYRVGKRKKTIETGETIELPNTIDHEYLTDFNQIVTFYGGDYFSPEHGYRTYFGAFKAGKLQQVWYETRN